LPDPEPGSAAHALAVVNISGSTRTRLKSLVLFEPNQAVPKLEINVESVF
jgi:hypothetical protein